MELYMIMLTGMGDTSISLVEEHVWNYIVKGTPFTQEVLENACETAKECYEDNLEDVSSSLDNDRAFIASWMCIDNFFNLKDAMTYIQKNNITLLDTYEGYIY